MTPREANQNSHSRPLLPKYRGQRSTVRHPTQERFSVPKRNSEASNTCKLGVSHALICKPGSCNRSAGREKTFQVGQKVVCIARVTDARATPHPGVSIGNIYTIVNVIHEPHWITPGLLLSEIAPRPSYVAFESLLFRPIVERKTDISIFIKMLTPAGVDA